MVNYVLLDVSPALGIDFLICETEHLLGHHSNLEVFLQLVDFLSVLLLATNESLLTAPDIVFDLVVLVQNLLGLFNYLREALIPVRWIRLVVGFWFVQIYFFHWRKEIKKLDKVNIT